MSAPDMFNPASWSEHLFKVIAAQAANLRRIDTDVVLDNPDAFGNTVTLLGPKLDVIRMNDAPARLQAKDQYANAERILTLAPLIDREGQGRIVGRNDRVGQYLVMAMIQLSHNEQRIEEGEEGTGNLLARKCDQFMHDFRAVFNDNHHLIYDGCPAGLVDEHTYDVQWDPDVQWPKALVVIQCTATFYNA